MGDTYINLTNAPSIDWVALLALFVSIISMLWVAWFNRRTLKLRQEHYKMSVEPFITDLYISDLYPDSNERPSQSYQIKNGGLGPAILKSLSFNINNFENKSIIELYEKYFTTQQKVKALYSEFKIDENHVISKDETIVLFKLTFDNKEHAEEFKDLARSISFELKYETVYKEPKTFTKENICIK